MLRRWLAISVVGGVGTLAAAPVPQPQAPWPDPTAYWTIKVTKLAGMEMTDPRWGHLHHHEPAASSLTLGVTIDHLRDEVLADVTASQLKIQYTVRGRPISPWLDPPYQFTIASDEPTIASLPSGIHDISVNVQAIAETTDIKRRPARKDFAPYPMFLHLGGRASRTTVVPVLTQNEQDNLFELSQMNGSYLDAAALVPKGYPADPSVRPWHQAPAYRQDLYQEQMQPSGEQFLGAQMLWEEPPGTVDAGLRFVRSMPPKSAESFVGLWNGLGNVRPTEFGDSGHRSFPVKDGPRGVGWTNGYVQGAVDGDGRLWMVNISGQLRVMHPDGELVTVVGWRVKSGKEPVWFLKPLASIRQNMEFRGKIESGGWDDPVDPGWHQPMDVALDPINPDRVFVASMYDNAIYRVDIDRAAWTGTVHLLAGDPNHGEGYVDGRGAAARFRHPFSLVASLDGRYLYVSDHDNDAIRRIEIETGMVTTAFGGPGVSQTLVGKPGVSCATDIRLACWPQSAVRAHVAVTGPRPTIYFPYFIRIASTGDLIVFDRGLNTLRRLSPETGTAELIDSLGDGGFDGNWARGWVWGDVDRWGNAGVRDGIYWLTATSQGPPPAGETEDRFNENYRYTSLDGSIKSWVFPSPLDSQPIGHGPISVTRPPHYPWLVAVDPRGAAIFGGIGTHGLTRLRLRRQNDPDISKVVKDLSFKDWRSIWYTGARGSFSYTLAPRSSVVPANPLANLHGWYAHNYIGMPDAWAVTEKTTDSEIDALFRWPPSIANDPVALRAVRSFVKLNRGALSTAKSSAPARAGNRD